MLAGISHRANKIASTSGIQRYNVRVQLLRRSTETRDVHGVAATLWLTGEPPATAPKTLDRGPSDPDLTAPF